MHLINFQVFQNTEARSESRFSICWAWKPLDTFVSEMLNQIDSYFHRLHQLRKSTCFRFRQILMHDWAILHNHHRIVSHWESNWKPVLWLCFWLIRIWTNPVRSQSEVCRTISGSNTLDYFDRRFRTIVFPISIELYSRVCGMLIWEYATETVCFRLR